MNFDLPLIELSPEHWLIDMPYADQRNFTGQAVYDYAYCYLHQEAYQCLLTVKKLAACLGLQLKIFDAYRPPEAQFILWHHTPDPDFLANPYRHGSGHSRGVAVDLTLVDNITHTELEMGTPFDEFSDYAWHGHTEISQEAQKNRLLLLGLMTQAGFEHYQHEWWHYNLPHTRRYPLVADQTLAPRALLKQSMINAG